MAEDEAPVHAQVEAYYANLQNSSDLKTNACCLAKNALPAAHKRILSVLHPEVLDKFYGCGSPLPDELTGCRVVDLGCGTGRDVYIASALVGEHGSVIGVDMTDEQLTVARNHIDYHSQQFGLPRPNVSFVKGQIENLLDAGIADQSVDVVISNCVVNLAPNKKVVLEEVFRVLKKGGELYFSDVFADRRIPERLHSDSVLWGECLSGALYVEDFRRLLVSLGYKDFRVMSSAPVTIGNEAVKAQVGPIQFLSLTIRAFKLGSLEDKGEDYGQTATYLGTIMDSADLFRFSLSETFPASKPVPVCGNTAAMLTETRYSKHFTVAARGDHRGLFKSGQDDATASEVGDCCS